MKKVLLIINPNSGRLKNKSMLFDIIEIMDKKGCVVTTRITQKAGDSYVFAKDGALSGMYDCIVCSGGDGTMSETIRGIVESGKDIPLGYIPSGSTNDYAKSMGIPTDMLEASVLSVCGTPREIDVGIIDNTYFDYVASFGAFTSVSYSAPQPLKNMLGHMAYVLAGIKDIAKIKSVKAKVSANSEIIEDDFIFGAITNATSIGGIVKLDDTLVEFNDGLFEVCLVKKPKSPSDFTKLIIGALNSDFTSDSFVFLKSDEINFELGKGLDWSLDGEKYSSGKKVKIKVLKSAVRINL